MTKEYQIVYRAIKHTTLTENCAFHNIENKLAYLDRCTKTVVVLDTENYILWSLRLSTVDLHANCYAQNEYAAL